MVLDENRKTTRGLVVHNLPFGLAQKYEERLRMKLGEKNIESLKNVAHPHSPGKMEDQDDHLSKELWILQFLDYLQGAIAACSNGVKRVHLVSRWIEGGIIAELYTREGCGIMVSRDIYDGVRPAKPEDVSSIMALIVPLEQQGILVTRPPEQVEAEIDKFIVFERDGLVLACCQLVHYEDERYEGGAAEMCCVAVSPSHRGSSMGSALLSYCMRCCAVEWDCTQLFILTTRSAHWFTDRGFVEAGPDKLPPMKRVHYNFTRKPKIYFKEILSERVADEYDLQYHSDDAT
jgi:amino-acid N-acetyltransferase